MNEVLKFWEAQAASHGSSPEATAPDKHYRELEISQIISHLAAAEMVLDVGCGNGYSTIKFQEAKPDTHFTGVDFSPTMIEAARAANTDKKHINFMIGDVRKLQYGSGSFDCVITERCLINLGDWNEQKDAILELKRVLQPGGRLIMVENTVEGLAGLNHVRKKFGLPEIKQRWHNRYIPHTKLGPFVQDHGFTIQCEQNIGSMYYLVSRVLHAKMAQAEGIEPAYDHVINELAAKLPTMPHYHYSPNVLWVLRKS